MHLYFSLDKTLSLAFKYGYHTVMSENNQEHDGLIYCEKYRHSSKDTRFSTDVWEHEDAADISECWMHSSNICKTFRILNKLKNILTSLNSDIFWNQMLINWWDKTVLWSNQSFEEFPPSTV